MDVIFELIRKKPLTQLLVTVFFLALTALFKWGLNPELAILTYLAGGLAGVYLLDAAEKFVRITPSPFKSILFAAAFSVTAFFVTTSSTSALASGMVFAVFFELLLRQSGDLSKNGNLHDWYRLFISPPAVTVEKYTLAGQVILLMIITFLFVRS